MDGADALAIKVVELAGSIVAPLTVLSALFYYFGWVRTNAIFAYFGADPAVLGFGPAEYLLRSAEAAFAPIVVMLLATAIVLAIGRVLNILERRWPAVPITIRRNQLTLRPVPAMLLVSGLVAVLVGAAVALKLVTYPPILAAAGLACGNLALWRAVRHLNFAPDALHRPKLAERAMLSGLIAIALFWGTAVYAYRQGEQLAKYIDENLEARPEVTIHSTDDLNLWSEPHGAMGRGKYPHRYRGLRLLTYANERWVLLTGELTTSGRHRLVIVRDDASIRVELST